VSHSLAIPGYSEIDVVAEGLVPSDWLEQIDAQVSAHATSAVLVGGTSTSLEPVGSNIQYRLLDGLAIHRCLPWLDEIYRGPLLTVASAAAGRRLVPSASVRSGVNLNILDGPGGRYELHLDSNPLTGLLFVTPHDERSGGQLLFRIDDSELRIDPVPGLFITFDARKLPHAVTPLTDPVIRISAPMNYYTADDAARPDDLDAYLYGRPSHTGGERDETQR
jgi:hypothetical protein